MATKSLAFAMAGLGGFNAHGAGFLQAARDTKQEPLLITATSGQIVVLGAYLNDEPDLRKGLIDPAIEKDPFAQIMIALTGYPGVFEPATLDAIKRLMSPLPFMPSFDTFAARFLPAELYQPTRTSAVIEALAQTLNAAGIGVVFNAYDPAKGTGVLYGNDKARALLNTRQSIPLLPGQQGNDPRLIKPDDKEEQILPIDAWAIKSALWLSLYGFDNMPKKLMDGAYHRSCIMSELHSFDRIVVCRPLANGFGKDRLPKSYFDVQDWNTEMWFSVGYKAEVDAMKRINTLVQKGTIPPGSGINYVDIREVEPDTPAGYFNYFIERDSVFRSAYEKALKTFAEIADDDKNPKGAPRQATR